MARHCGNLKEPDRYSGRTTRRKRRTQASYTTRRGDPRYGPNSDRASWAILRGRFRAEHVQRRDRASRGLWTPPDLTRTVDASGEQRTLARVAHRPLGNLR